MIKYSDGQGGSFTIGIDPYECDNLPRCLKNHFIQPWIHIPKTCMDEYIILYVPVDICPECGWGKSVEENE